MYNWSTVYLKDDESRRQVSHSWNHCKERDSSLDEPVPEIQNEQMEESKTSEIPNQQRMFVSKKRKVQIDPDTEP